MVTMRDQLKVPPATVEVGVGRAVALIARPALSVPAATRSGLSRLSTARTPVLLVTAPRVGPRELKPFTTSSERPVVSFMFDEPTLITDGSCPGEPTVPKVVAPPICP